MLCQKLPTCSLNCALSMPLTVMALFGFFFVSYFYCCYMFHTSASCSIQLPNKTNSDRSFSLNFLQVFRGTIADAPDFDPAVDAETLYNAMKGIGKCLINWSFCRIIKVQP